MVKWISHQSSELILEVRILSGAFAPLAQLVEQIPLKDKVAGSNPARGTSIKLSGILPTTTLNF